MTAGGSAAEELRRATCEAFAAFVAAGGSLEVKELVSRSWASITFSGERHVLRLRLEGGGAAAAADAFLEGLSERDFYLRGHILADLALVSEKRAAGLVYLAFEALTVEAS